MKNKTIYVTQPSLTPLNEYSKLLEGVWERGILDPQWTSCAEIRKKIFLKN